MSNTSQHLVVFDGTRDRPLGRYLFGAEEPPPAPRSAPPPPKVYTLKPKPDVYTGIVGQIRDALLADRLTAHELASRFNWPPDQTADRLYRLQAKGLVKVVERRKRSKVVHGHSTEAIWAIV